MFPPILAHKGHRGWLHIIRLTEAGFQKKADCGFFMQQTLFVVVELTYAIIRGYKPDFQQNF
jgi:hypothetical protein